MLLITQEQADELHFSYQNSEGKKTFIGQRDSRHPEKVMDMFTNHRLLPLQNLVMFKETLDFMYEYEEFLILFNPAHVVKVDENEIKHPLLKVWLSDFKQGNIYTFIKMRNGNWASLNLKMPSKSSFSTYRSASLTSVNERFLVYLTNYCYEYKQVLKIGGDGFDCNRTPAGNWRLTLFNEIGQADKALFLADNYEDFKKFNTPPRYSGIVITEKSLKTLFEEGARIVWFDEKVGEWRPVKNPSWSVNIKYKVAE